MEIALPKLEIGDEGHAVVILQTLMVLAGEYTGSITGVYDSATRKSVLQIKRIKRMEPNDDFDKATDEVWKYLLTKTPPDQEYLKKGFINAGQNKG